MTRLKLAGTLDIFFDYIQKDQLNLTEWSFKLLIMFFKRLKIPYWVTRMVDVIIVIEVGW